MTEHNLSAMSGRERGELLRDAIYKAYETNEVSRPPNSIGMGWIGAECSRDIWYRHRWVLPPEKFSGRMLKLFEDGKMHETLLLNDLRRVDAAVFDSDPNDSRKQIGVSALNGHSKGFLDAAAQNVPFALEKWIVVECKSHGLKSFKALLADGVERAKPEHHGQYQMYMAQQGLKEALYLAICKDTSELYCEFVAHDPRFTERLLVKGAQILGATMPPMKLSQDAAFFKCRFCKNSDVCHKDAMPQRSCRTCIFSEMRAEGAWYCTKHSHELTFDQQRAGCADQRLLPSIVPGQQEDAAADGSWIKYLLPSGEVFLDGEKVA